MTARRASRVAAPLACSLALLVTGVAGTAGAQVRAEVLPVFGEGCVPRSGATELVVGITNDGAARVEGTVRLDQPGATATGGVRTVMSVPFAVGARTMVTVRLPTGPEGVGSGDRVVRVDAQNRGFVTQLPLRYANPVDSLLVDATPQSRLSFAMRAAATPDPMAPSPAGSTPLSAAIAGLTPCPAMRAPSTGEVVLPRSLAGYNGVAMVLVDAASVMSLPPAERAAFADYLLAGGTATIVPARADELRHPTLAALLGQGIVGVTPPPLDPTAGAWISAVPGTAPGTFPANATLHSAESFRGGNLHYRTLAPMFPWGAPELLGASAEYGLGHLHVLSFNPAMPPGVEDPWALTLVGRLAQQASTGRTVHLLGDAADVASVPSAVRRALDPNEGFRAGLGLAAVLLVLYALLAGPLAFRLAARRGRPLRALAQLPLWSGLVFAGIVTLGVVSRGWQGRARRIALMELPAGLARGPVRRFHGYYSGESGAMEVAVRGLDRRLYADPQSGTGFATMSLERDGTALRGLAGTAWTTTVVREEGYETLRGSVTIQPDGVGQLRVVNLTPYTLRQVMLLGPGGSQAWSFREIRPRATVLASQGTPVPAATAALLTGAGGYVPTTPYGTSFGNSTGATSTPGWQLAMLFNGGPEAAQRWDAYVAISTAAGASWSLDPVLIGVLDAPVPDGSDGGLRIDQETLFVRVVGYGGAT